MGPVGEDPDDSLKSSELEIMNKKILDENVKINSELHKMVAERLYDLKKSLRKPDIVGITTPDARNKKIEEYSQRSVESLKDQIKDLLLEQDQLLTTGQDDVSVNNPAISQSDWTAEVLEDKKKVKEGKQDTLIRLFSKSK
jgi:ribosomal protein L21